ncbi:hypothetical protein A4X13_0g6924 [Tilletia indica]|uniref:Uncharacterized protein n=1 Tax=Tilletia indica TaxID=43049 RepID=A0A177T602_9BASI|nr:hypothetical protein A4X13_0g6924 [Tilletia indica]
MPAPASKDDTRDGGAAEDQAPAPRTPEQGSPAVSQNGDDGQWNDEPAFLSEDEPEEYRRKSPTPNVEKLVKAWKVRDLSQWIRAVPPADFVAKLATSEEYINMDSFLERLSAATLDDKGRFMAKDSDGVLHELRFCYAAKGKSAFGFNNGKTGTAFPMQWASEATRPSTVVIETCPGNTNMRRKRTTEGTREYSTNVFTNAQSPKAWSMSTSLPPANAVAEAHLRRALAAAGTRIKALWASLLAGPDKKWTWAEPTLGGSAMWPRVERAIFVAAGEDMDQGRTSEVTQDHDLARTIGDDQSLRYNTVPEVTVLDTDDHDFWKVSWHLAHDLPAAGMWEVGFHIRAYKSAARRKVGYGVVLESLVLHGKAPASTLTSPVPIKRKVDYFAGYEGGEAKKQK